MFSVERCEDAIEISLESCLVMDSDVYTWRLSAL